MGARPGPEQSWDEGSRQMPCVLCRVGTDGESGRRWIPYGKSGQRYGSKAELAQREEGQIWMSTDNAHTCLLRTLMLALTNTEKRTGKKTNSGNIHIVEYYSATKRSEAPTLTTT